MPGLIAREDHGGVAVLWLDRPDRLNALDAALRAALTEAPRAALTEALRAAQAAPDGHTLVMSHPSPFGVAAGTYPNLPYNVADDFTHLALLAESAHLVMVRGDSPIRTLAHDIALARRQPVRFGSSGIGSGTHLMGEYLSRLANAPNLEHIPYRGSAPGLQDLLAGRIESMFDPITTNTAMIRDRQVHVLTLSTPSRIPAFPEIPTFAEQGFPQLTNTT